MKLLKIIYLYLFFKYLVDLARKVFGYDSLELADAYRSLSKALIINKIFNGDYYELAAKAHKIAIDHFSLDDPKLIAYQLSLALALQWKSINSNVIEIKKVNINDSYNLCKRALEVSLQLFDEKNIQVAKIYRLISSVLYYMERDADSAEYNLKSVQIFKDCLSGEDLHYLVSKSNYGIFLKMIGKVNEAISVLLEVVNKMSKLYSLNQIFFCN